MVNKSKIKVKDLLNLKTLYKPERLSKKLWTDIKDFFLENGILTPIVLSDDGIYLLQGYYALKAYEELGFSDNEVSVTYGYSFSKKIYLKERFDNRSGEKLNFENECLEKFKMTQAGIENSLKELNTYISMENKIVSEFNFDTYVDGVIKALRQGKELSEQKEIKDNEIPVNTVQTITGIIEDLTLRMEAILKSLTPEEISEKDSLSVIKFYKSFKFYCKQILEL